MSSLSIRTSRGAYDVLIEPDSLAHELGRCDAVVVDPVVAIPDVEIPVIPFEAREDHKTLHGVEQVLIGMHERGLRRGSLLAAVGGGVVQDVGTLAASIYMRGVNWLYAPTTMMAMLDSCIGGKSSINVSGIKNLVGNIYPPSQVLVDVTVARTLPIEARIAGYAEAVKICFAGGPEPFARYLDLALPAEEFGSPETAAESSALVRHVLEVKQWFIEIDEFDKKERLLLNFGHTFGHALEAALDFSIPHGVGVALGMSAAVKFSGTSGESLRMLDNYVEMLAAQLPDQFVSRLSPIDWDRFERALASDKKGTASHLRFVLPNADGSLELVERERSGYILRVARQSAEDALTQFAASLGGST